MQRLFKGPAVDLGDDLDQVGQSIGRGRRSPLLDDLDGGSLGVAEKVTGNRQAEEPLVSGRGQGGLLPCSEPAKLFEPALFQMEELPVVLVVDRLDSLFGPGRTNNLGRDGLALS